MPVFNNELQDDPLALDACPSFSGGQVSFKRANLLDATQAAALENVSILLSGEARKRRGSRNVGPGYVGAAATRIQGMLYFDTVVDDKLVAFCAGKALAFDGLNWSQIFDAAISDTAEIIDCCQLTDLIYWTDSDIVGIREWDGTTVSTVAGSPKARVLSVHGTRLVASAIADVPDAVDFSDLLDGGTWNTTTQRLRIGIGDGDPVVGHISWQETGVIVFNRQSVWLINADPQADVADFGIKLVHGTVGCVARKTIAQVGQDVWFLSRSGVQSVQKQLATDNNQITVPVSQAVQDVIARIRWDQASKACARFYNNQYLLSVPIASNEPDTVLCFNTLTGGWTIIAGWDACFFLEQPYEGQTRLLIGTNQGFLREWLDYLPEDSEPADAYKEGYAGLDLPFDLPVTLLPTPEVESRILTRAMIFNEPINPKSGFYGEMEYVLSDVEFSVNAILDGRESVEVATVANSISQTILPTTLPFEFPAQAGWARRKFPLHHLRPFRELQLEVLCPVGKLILRDITVSAFVDTLELRNY